MRKEILSSIIITILLLTSVYFVVSSGIGTQGRLGGQTHYNVTDGAGNIETSANSVWWNPYTNYSGNTSVIKINTMFFNFTINNTATVFTGNITNITINFTAKLFEVSGGNGNLSLTGANPLYYSAANTVTGIIFYNSSNGGLTNGSGESGGIQYHNGTFQVNVTVNGSGNTNTELPGTIFINGSNSSNTGSSTISFSLGVDSQAPRITNIQVTDGTSTQNVITSGSVYLKNSSNITIYATITDANIWHNITADRHTGPNRFGNITIWWNATGSGAVRKGNTGFVNATNMTNLTSCTWTQGASGCVFYATLPRLGNQQQEYGNVSFVITASDYFQHTSNASVSGGVIGYNITFDNTARDCDISIPDSRFIVYREYTISCDGDANTTILRDGDGNEICNAMNACSGTYTPTKSGTQTLSCETKDSAANTKTCSKDITVYSRETVMSNEGGSTSTTETPTTVDISQGAESTGMSTGQSTTFRYATEDHNIVIDSITSDSVTLTIDSKISATIPSGQSKEIDLTGDGTNDVKVTLNRVLLNKADISIEKLAGATTETQPEVVQEEQGSMAWLWWVLILIVVAIIAYLVISAKKKK